MDLLAKIVQIQNISYFNPTIHKRSNYFLSQFFTGCSSKLKPQQSGLLSCKSRATAEEPTERPTLCYLVLSVNENRSNPCLSSEVCWWSCSNNLQSFVVNSPTKRLNKHHHCCCCLQIVAK